MLKISFYTVLLNLLLITSLSAQIHPIRTIKADFLQVSGAKSSVYNGCIGAGRANEGLRADWQQQLAIVQKEAAFKYIRFHGLLHDDMAVYTNKNGKKVFNWQYIDKLYDYLLSINIKPFVEIGFMPSDLASGTKTIFWWKGNISKPKSYSDWDELIVKLVTHFEERYGRAEVEKWYFEVWNEPNLSGFFDGTIDDYFELYAHTAKAVKSVSPTYRIGGPATSATRWINEFLEHCTKNKLPVDFISTHDYGTTSMLDEFGTRKQRLKNNPDTVANNVIKVRGQMNVSAFKAAELHFTEWNTSPSSRDPIHDSYQNATFVLNTLKKAAPYSNSMSYWTFTDIFEEAGPAQTPFHGGFGLMNLQSIKKPTFYAYKYLSNLGNTELINKDASSIICKSNQDVQALIWDFTFTDTGKEFNQDYFVKKHPADAKHDVKLELVNLKNGKYRLEIYQTGYKKNDPFTAFYDMGKPDHLSKAQVAELMKQSADLPLSNKDIIVTNGTFKHNFVIRQNDMFLVKLIKK